MFYVVHKYARPFRKLLTDIDNLFICFILFILWFRVKTKQSSKEENKSIEEFLTREQEANFTRKKDISNLEYISVNMEILPFFFFLYEYEIQLENNVK